MKGRSGLLFWIGLAVLLVAIGWFGGRQRADGPPLDPSSTGPLGTRALTELVEEYGASVRRGTPSADTEVTLLLVDRLGDLQRDELERWVRDGGRLVVADPSSTFSPGLSDLVSDRSLDQGRCEIPELDNVQLVEAENFVRYTIGSRAPCFGNDQVAFVVSEPLGDGQVISLGGAIALTNQELDRADNAVLAVNLLAFDGGELAIVFDPAEFGGERSLGDLIPTSVRWLGWQLVVAFAIYLVWRARRFGGVVAEPQLVEMPGSLLVRASGELGRRSKGHPEAAARLRRDLERRLRSEYRLPLETDRVGVVSVVSQRASVDPDLLTRALLGPPPSDGGDLSQVVADIDSVTAATLHSAPVTHRPVTQGVSGD